MLRKGRTQSRQVAGGRRCGCSEESLDLVVSIATLASVSALQKQAPLKSSKVSPSLMTPSSPALPSPSFCAPDAAFPIRYLLRRVQNLTWNVSRVETLHTPASAANRHLMHSMLRAQVSVQQ